MLDAGRGHQAGGPAGQQRGLLVQRHRERVDLVVGDPLHVAVRRLGGQLHRPQGHRGGHLRGPYGGLRHADRGLPVEHHAGGEPPGAVEDHPDREADVLGVARRPASRPSRTRDRLGADPLEPEVGVADVEVLGPRQRGLTHPPVGKCGERAVDLLPGHDPRLCRKSPGRTDGSSHRCVVRCGRRAPARRAVRCARPSTSPAVRRTRPSGPPPAPAGSSSTSTTTVRVAASRRSTSTLNSRAGRQSSWGRSSSSPAGGGAGRTSARCPGAATRGGRRGRRGRTPRPAPRTVSLALGAGAGRRRHRRRTPASPSGPGDVVQPVPDVGDHPVDVDDREHRPSVLGRLLPRHRSADQGAHRDRRPGRDPSRPAPGWGSGCAAR